ncbi:MAG: peptidase M48 [Ignavibacteria bacterium GWC2_36_12]|nr:MAG: peptidase M48 [Ignavibacteria bacterium GWC2_36_12]OGU93716.1 MAG: peptidase M48 [Ignavibacteria bacterium RIFOXYB2_FULL_36_7]
MKKLKILFLSIITAFSILSCSTVPLTGRSQLNLIPANEMLSLSYQQYDEFLNENKVSKDAKNTAMVKRVGTNIQHAVEEYLAQNNLSNRLEGYKWEFNLVEDEQVNAWCMPGGKVVVYTGILPVTKNEIGLAVVLGHEIAHAIAEHGNERMSQGLIQQLGGAALSVALRDKPQLTQDLFLTAYGVGSTVGILAYSRTQESEADHLGLIFMAMAGYNPGEAVNFWQRMAEINKGQKPPEFLSTHPSDETRINDIKKWLPDALKYYKK